VKFREVPFDSPEVDEMLAGVDWKILSPSEAAVLKNWLLKNSASRTAGEEPPKPETPEPPADTK